MKKLYTLLVRDLKNGMCEVTKGAAAVAKPQTPDHFFRVLEQLGDGPSLIALRRKEYETRRCLWLREIELDEAGLRLLGFTAV